MNNASKSSFAKQLGNLYWTAFKEVNSKYPKFALHFLLISFLFLSIAGVSAYVPFLLRQAANEVGRNASLSNDFYIYAFAYAAGWTLENVLENIKGIFSAGVLARSDAALNKAILTSIWRYPHVEQKKIAPAAVAEDIDRAAQSFSAITVSAFWSIAPIVFGFATSIGIVWNTIGERFAVLFGLCIALLAHVSYLIAAKSGDIHSSIFLAQNQLQNYTIERLGSLLDTRLNQAEDREQRLADIHLRRMVRTIWRANLKMGIFLGSHALAIGLVLGIFTVHAVQLNASRSLTSGDFVMIAGYVGMLTMQLRFLSAALIDLKRSHVALQGGLDYVRTDAEATTRVPRSAAVAGDGEPPLFSLEEICIAVGDKALTAPFSHSFGRGLFHAIAAPSGAGKTTLIHTMLGLLPPSGGSVTFEGKEVNARSVATILDRVAVAPQAPKIFNDTLRFNLGYGGDRDIPDQELMELLEIFGYPAATASGEPSILEEKVGIGGRALSGGEQQRISIARAYLRHKDTLILDEPTAALNQSLALRIVEFLAARVRTLIVVTHDPAILQRAHQVLTLPAARR